MLHLPAVVPPGSPHLLRYQCGSREVHQFRPPPNRPIPQMGCCWGRTGSRMSIVRQTVWRQVTSDSLSHTRHEGSFYCPGSSAAVVQQRLKHETQPMRQPVMSFAKTYYPWNWTWSRISWLYAWDKTVRIDLSGPYQHLPSFVSLFSLSTKSASQRISISVPHCLEISGNLSTYKLTYNYLS